LGKVNIMKQPLLSCRNCSYIVAQLVACFLLQLFDMDLQQLKRQFLEYLEIEQGSSAKTVENYGRYLERFLAFSNVRKPTDLTEEHINEFRLHLSHQPGTKIGSRVEPMKLRTQNYYLIALRVFLKYMNGRGIETISPERIELAKVAERSFDLISSAELTRLRVAPDTKTIQGKRDQAILELLFSTGLRISELCTLSINTVDLASDEFPVRGKGDTIRLVFLSDVARNAIKDYLKARKDIDNALFVRHGRKVNDGGDLRLQARAIQRLLKTYARMAGITRKVTPHVIRHTFATDLLQNGADIRSVQALLGHTNINTTQMYTRVTDKKLRNVHKKFNGR
jgi:site-specific recombinase XerD